MSKYKVTGIIYVHIGMHDSVTVKERGGETETEGEKRGDGGGGGGGHGESC